VPRPIDLETDLRERPAIHKVRSTGTWQSTLAAVVTECEPTGRSRTGPKRSALTASVE